MNPRVASPKVNTTLVLRNRGAGELVDSRVTCRTAVVARDVDGHGASDVGYGASAAAPMVQQRTSPLSQAAACLLANPCTSADFCRRYV